MLALLFKLVPVFQNLVLRIGFHRAENVRVPVNQLLADVVANIVKVEISLFGLYLRMENHLHKQIAQLLAEHFGAVRVNALADLVCLLDKIGANAFVRLHLIPRAAVFRAKNFHYLQEVANTVTFLKLEIQYPQTPFKKQSALLYYPISRYFARGFLNFLTFFCFIMPLVRKTPDKISKIA